MPEFKHNFRFSENDANLKGFQEVVFSISNLDRELDFYQRVLGYELVSQHNGNDALKQLWHLEKIKNCQAILILLQLAWHLQNLS